MQKIKNLKKFSKFFIIEAKLMVEKVSRILATNVAIFFILKFDLKL